MPDGLEITVRLDSAQLEQIAQRAADILSERRQAHDGYLNAQQAADFLGCPRSRIYDHIQTGRLTPVRDGRSVRFRVADLRAHMEGS